MKIFQCGNCKSPLFFENNKCDQCGYLIGYRAEDQTMLAFKSRDENLVLMGGKLEYKYCKNEDYNLCNWVLEVDKNEDYCSACQLNRTIPNLSNPNSDNFDNWKHLEFAKHRLIYQLEKLGLPLASKLKQDDGLCFDFIEPFDDPKIMTGHADGVVTILLKEGNSAVREQAKTQLNERYRTLVGHLRHEVGHYYWNLLVRDNPQILEEFRAIFGNEELDYSEALENYYKTDAPENWNESYISTYATSHPWEDWAETWAHYLHIMDMVETGYYLQLSVKPKLQTKALDAKVSFDPYTKKNFDVIVKTCIPLSLAVNSINRAMGVPDAYPFIISPKVIEKLKFMHRLLLRKP